MSGVFNDDDFHWSYVTPLSVARAISRAGSNAVGVDGISLVILKIAIHHLMPILEHIFNFSLTSGVFPLSVEGCDRMSDS